MVLIWLRELNERMNQGRAEESTTSSPVRRLRRSDRGTVGGVATGLAEFLDTEPLLFQVAFVLLSLFSGAGLLFYLGAWMLVPREDGVDPRPIAVTGNAFAIVAGLTLGVLGLVALTQGIVWGPNVFIPAAMILIGAWLLNQRAEVTSQPPGPGPGPTSNPAGNPMPPTPTPPPPFPTPPAPGPAPTWGPASAATTATGPTPPPPEPPPPSAWRPSAPAGTGPQATGHVPPPRAHWARTRLDEPKSEPKPPGPPVTSITMAVTAVVIGALLVIRNVGSTDLGVTVFVGAILAVLGAGLVASSILGRARPLVFLSILAMVVLLIAPLLDTTLRGGIGTERVMVTSESGVAQPSYSVGMGELRVDLRNLDPTIDHEIEVTVGAGQATVIVADDMQIELEATTRAGYLDIVNEVDEGVFNEVRHLSDGDGDGSEPGGGTLKLTIDVTFGYAEVIRRG